MPPLFKIAFLLKEETTLGNLVTDAMVWAYRDKTTEQEEPFRMAVHHSGGIRFLILRKEP